MGPVAGSIVVADENHPRYPRATCPFAVTAFNDCFQKHSFDHPICLFPATPCWEYWFSYASAVTPVNEITSIYPRATFTMRGACPFSCQQEDQSGIRALYRQGQACGAGGRRRGNYKGTAGYLYQQANGQWVVASRCLTMKVG
jgi:hypothetical protein